MREGIWYLCEINEGVGTAGSIGCGFVRFWLYESCQDHIAVYVCYNCSELVRVRLVCIRCVMCSRVATMRGKGGGSRSAL